MAVGVKVNVSNAAIIAALNTPGGGVFRWRDEVGAEIKKVAESRSPVNNPLNALHRGGVVGTYRAGWDWNRRGSNGHIVRANVFNTADHAQIVEYGRSAAFARQSFSWTAFDPPGSIHTVRRTRRRAGRHVLGRAAVAVLGSAGIRGVGLG